MSRPTKVSVDLSAIQHNFSIVRKVAPASRVVACVKANAYGHGAVEVARALSEADLFGVASIEEAIELQDGGIENQPILLLEGFFDGSELEEIASRDLQTVVHSSEQLELFLSSALPTPITVWLKIDTGMHRLGIDKASVREAFNRLQASENCSKVRLMSHFACAEELENPFTQIQVENFQLATEGLSAEASLANSAAILARPETHRDWVRPGFMLYGNSPFAEPHELADQLQPAMSFSTEIISIRQIKAGEGVGYNHNWRAERDSTIAVAAVGYGDGYPRNTQNGCPVMINGAEAQTIGHVAMDLLTMDVTDLTNVNVGDVVELWGKNLSVNRVAAHSGYSPYELLTRMPSRANKSYHC